MVTGRSLCPIIGNKFPDSTPELSNHPPVSVCRTVSTFINKRSPALALPDFSTPANLLRQELGLRVPSASLLEMP